VDLFGRAAHASVKELRIIPSRYPAWLTPKEIVQIQKDIAKLLGTVPPPTPTPTPTPTPSGSPAPSDSTAPSASPSDSPPEPSASP
jgi:hypothetical protein